MAEHDDANFWNSKKQFGIFDLDTLPWVPLKKNPFRDDVESYAIGMTEFKIPIKGAGEEGLMLSLARFKPHFYVPKHSHNVDHMALVLEGEEHFGQSSKEKVEGNLVKHRGKLVLTKGHGYFVKAGSMYGPFWAGPEGLVIAEFRSVSRFTTTYYDDAEVERLSANRLAEMTQGEIR